jgi:release factor glutamine methyltransferase
MTCIKDLIQNHHDFKIPRLDLELLIAHVQDCCRTKLYSHPEETLSGVKLKKLKSLVSKRSKGIPLAYLTNHKEFHGLDFYVDERVLIPRPETEMIVDKALRLKPKTLLDIGVGSGTIALTIAVKYPACEVHAVDISQDALDVAEHNSERFDVDIKLIKSDLVTEIPVNTHYDVITANLPYIGELDQFDPNEPDLALFAGHDGLDLYRQLFDQLKAKNITFGTLLGEFGFGQEQAIIQLLKEHFGQSFEIRKDLAEIPRMFVITQ